MVPLIWIIDNTHLMDAASWEFIELLRDSQKNLVLVVLQKTDFGRICVKPESKGKFEEVWYCEQMNSLVQVEMPPLTKRSLGQLLLSHAQAYYQTFADELHKMTLIDPQKPKVEGFKKTPQSA
jgi:hypothetical protein